MLPANVLRARTASLSWSAWSRSSSRRSVQASCTARMMSTNPGRPWWLDFGKYVPAKNGRPSGVMNTVIGQPPLPVIACVASM